MIIIWWKNLYVKGTELKKLNKCRMFLEVSNLSEIMMVDGKQIKPLSWKGIKDTNKCNQFQWLQAPPALLARHYKIWRWAL
jgi:hypothetical protein